MSDPVNIFRKNLQYYKFCFYGFLKNLRFFEPFLILFFLESGLSFLQIGVLYSIREIARYLLEIPAGFIADSIGRRITMVTSFSFYILSFVVFYTGSFFFIFIFAMICYSIGDAFRTGTHKAMIFDYLKINGWEDQKVSYYGHTRSFSQLGSALSALLAGFFIFFTGMYRAIFLIAIVPYFLDLLLVISYPKELDGNLALLNKKQIGANFKKTWKDFKKSLRQLNLMRSIANVSVFTGYYKSIKDYLQPIIQALAISIPVLSIYEEKQRTAVLIGMVYFIIYLLTSFSARNSGRLIAYFKSLSVPMNLTLVTGLVSGIFAGMFYEQQWLVFSVIALVLIFVLENIRKPAGVSYIAEAGNTDILATILSVESQAHTLVAACLAPVIGWMADYTGIGNALLVVSALVLLSTPLYWLKGK
ncbi:MAG: MFS transporter [Bacteroidales bacterium]|nr:MFS transporter [Bacteroidales bacterium]